MEEVGLVVGVALSSLYLMFGCFKRKAAGQRRKAGRFRSRNGPFRVGVVELELASESEDSEKAVGKRTPTSATKHVKFTTTGFVHKVPRDQGGSWPQRRDRSVFNRSGRDHVLTTIAERGGWVPDPSVIFGPGRQPSKWIYVPPGSKFLMKGSGGRSFEFSPPESPSPSTTKASSGGAEKAKGVAVKRSRAIETAMSAKTKPKTLIQLPRADEVRDRELSPPSSAYHQDHAGAFKFKKKPSSGSGSGSKTAEDQTTAAVSKASDMSTNPITPKFSAFLHSRFKFTPKSNNPNPSGPNAKSNA